MNMSARIFSRFLCSATVLLAGLSSFAQTQPGAYGSYSPYSIYGVGNLHEGGSAYNKSMGGVGIAMRDNRYLNIKNPASVTARDSLSFMVDMSLYNTNRVFRQSGNSNSNNVVNIGDIAISFPLFRNAAMMVGVTPYSSSGYNYTSNNITTDPSVIVNSKNVTYSAEGQGSLYEVFAAAGVSFLNNRLSIGGEVIEHFGDIEKQSNLSFGNSSFSKVENGTVMNLWGSAGKIGVQYEQPIGKSKVGVGATYKTSTRLKGFIDDYGYVTNGSQIDTLKMSKDTLSGSTLMLSDEISFGLAYYYQDKLKIGVDFTMSGPANGWEKCGIDSQAGMGVVGSSVFSAGAAKSLKAGFEYVPNRNDIRYYFRRVSYRAGAYWNQEYYKVNGKSVNSYGITLGATLPVFRLSNGITFAMDLGKRSVKIDNPVKETYMGFSVGFNLYDIWFQKNLYN